MAFKNIDLMDAADNDGDKSGKPLENTAMNNNNVAYQSRQSFYVQPHESLKTINRKLSFESMV